MAVFEMMEKAIQNNSVDRYADLMAEDFTFVRHQSGSELNKSQTRELLEKMFVSGSGSMGARRKIYENDDILVTQSVNDYPDGSRESVISVYALKNGKVTRLETGATPIKK